MKTKIYAGEWIITHERLVLFENLILLSNNRHPIFRITVCFFNIFIEMFWCSPTPLLRLFLFFGCATPPLWESLLLFVFFLFVFVMFSCRSLVNHTRTRLTTLDHEVHLTVQPMERAMVGPGHVMGSTPINPILLNLSACKWICNLYYSYQIERL